MNRNAETQTHQVENSLPHLLDTEAQEENTERTHCKDHAGGNRGKA